MCKCRTGWDLICTFHRAGWSLSVLGSTPRHPVWFPVSSSGHSFTLSIWILGSDNQASKGPAHGPSLIFLISKVGITPPRVVIVLELFRPLTVFSPVGGLLSSLLLLFYTEHFFPPLASWWQKHCSQSHMASSCCPC